MALSQLTGPSTAAGAARATRRALRCSALAPPPSVSYVALPEAQAQAVAPAESPAAAKFGAASLTAPSPAFLSADAASAPAVAGDGYVLPEGTSWRYSEFINAVTRGKVERVRFAKDGAALQLTAVDGCASPLARPPAPRRAQPPMLWRGPPVRRPGAACRAFSPLLWCRPSG